MCNNEDSYSLWSDSEWEPEEPQVHPGQWRTRDGRLVMISAMPDAHLLNTIRYIESHRNDVTVEARSKITELKQEAMIRGLDGAAAERTR